MTERFIPQNINLLQPPAEIIRDISEISKQISDIYSLKDISYKGRLTNGEYAQVRALHQSKDQKIIDLLLVNNEKPNLDIQVVLSKFPREKIHAYSMNSVFIYVPSTENPGQPYMIKAELSDLRRNGVVTDSKQAETLLGDFVLTNDTVGNFIYRTNSELVSIKRGIRELKEKDPKIDEMEELCANLILERLLPLRNNPQFPPNSSLELHMYEDKEGEIISEAANLVLDGKTYKFEIPGQRLLPTVEQIGGYDKIVTCF